MKTSSTFPNVDLFSNVYAYVMLMLLFWWALWRVWCSICIVILIMDPLHSLSYTLCLIQSFILQLIFTLRTRYTPARLCLQFWVVLRWVKSFNHYGPNTADTLTLGDMTRRATALAVVQGQPRSAELNPDTSRTSSGPSVILLPMWRCCHSDSSTEISLSVPLHI